MNNKAPDRNERDLMVIMVYGTCLSFGLMAAFLYSMRNFMKDASLVFSFGSIVAFVVGWIGGWVFWRVFRNLMTKAEAEAAINEEHSSKA